MNYDNILGNGNDPKQAELRTGYSIAKMLREVDKVESKIGTILEGRASGPKYLITTGMQIGSIGEPTNILGDYRLSLEVSQKFKSINGKSVTALLRQYIDDSKSTDGIELLNNIRDIENNKLLLTPIKPKMSCEIIIEEDELDERMENLPDSARTNKKRSRIKTSNIEIVKWYTERETGKLQCCVLTDVLDGTSGKRAKVSIEEYGKTLFLTDIERSIKVGADTEHRFISMTRHGFIKPIKIVNKLGNGIIIDNTFIYSVNSYDTEGNGLTPIAYWNNSDELVGGEPFEQIQKTTLYNTVKKNLTYVAQHRRYIAPNGTVECNTLTI